MLEYQILKVNYLELLLNINVQIIPYVTEYTLYIIRNIQTSNTNQFLSWAIAYGP